MIDGLHSDDIFAPVARQSLADVVASRISGSIRTGVYAPGDRLPSIDAMARAFGVGPGSVRAALTKLEVMRVVQVRHGLGVFVTSRQESSSAA